MTEKRFTMYQNTIYDNGNILSPFNCMKVMNILHNENEQLKQVAEEFIENQTQHNLWKLRTILKELKGDLK